MRLPLGFPERPAESPASQRFHVEHETRSPQVLGAGVGRAPPVGPSGDPLWTRPHRAEIADGSGLATLCRV